MIRLGLVGYPLEHSLSPKIHAAALRSCGLEGDYSLFLIHPDDKQGLKDLLVRLRTKEFHGLNVTIPHKQNVIPLLDQLTSIAQTIGAVNTIYVREDKLIGDNTDVAGFLKDLDRFLADDQSKITSRKSAIVLGAGGSARAVSYALLNEGWQVIIAARRVEQAERLATSFLPYELRIANGDLSDVNLPDIALVVNTTPVGMSPGIDRSPWPREMPFPKGAAIYDLVYNPRETKLVRDASAQGLSATTGLGMLIEQAVLAFEIWTGHSPSRELMRSSVK